MIRSQASRTRPIFTIESKGFYDFTHGGRQAAAWTTTAMVPYRRHNRQHWQTERRPVTRHRAGGEPDWTQGASTRTAFGKTSNVINAVTVKDGEQVAGQHRYHQPLVGHPIYDSVATTPLCSGCRVKPSVRASSSSSLQAILSTNPFTGLTGYAGITPSGNAPPANTGCRTNVWHYRGDDYIGRRTARAGHPGMTARQA